MSASPREPIEGAYGAPGEGATRAFADPPDLADDESVRTVAEYIADMSEQLESMARAASLELLSYLLAMARAEADTISRLPSRGVARPR